MVDPPKHWAGKNAPAFIYPDLLSSIIPVPNFHELHVKESSNETAANFKRDSNFEKNDVSNPDYRGIGMEINTSKSLNDMIIYVILTKSNAELQTLRLKLLDGNVQVAGQSYKRFSYLFTRQDRLCFCHTVTGLFDANGISFKDSECQLFLNISPRSHKDKLLPNRNIYPSPPMA